MTQTGVYVGTDPTAFAAYSKWVGSTPGNVLNYLNNDSWKAFDSSIGWATGLWKNTAAASIWSVPLTVTGTSLEQVATGAFNDHFLKAAQGLAQTKASSDGNIYVRVGWEFNGSWMPWAANGHEAAFIKSFQELVTTFRSVSDKFKFVWDTTNDGGNMNPERAYPGDKYVDVIGTDVYYSTQWDGMDAAKGFRGEVTRAYGLQWQQDFAAAHGKATAISEWGVASDNAAPYVQAMTKWMADHNMVYENYWDSNGGGYSGQLSAGANATAGAAYKSAISILQGAASESLQSVAPPLLLTAPSIAITSSGGLTNTLAVKLAGTVGLSDAGTTVHVLDGATEIGTALVQADGKWSAAVSLLNQQGSHQISASDTNAVGTGKSSSVSYTVDTVAPVVKLGLVQDTGASSTDKITTNSALTGTAEAGAKVTLSEGTTTLGSVTADSTGHWNFTPTGLKLGAHTILASQTDAAGNIGSDTFAFTLQNAPTIVITSSGGLTNTLAVKLAGTVGLSDAGTTVHVLDGATEIGTALVQADGKWSAAVSLLNQQGSHQISASDTNAVGTGKSSSVSYTVDTVAPVVKLGLVQDTGASSTDKITTNSALTGTAEAGAKVTLSEGTTTLGSVTADSTGHWNFTPTGLKLGAHTILASQTDAAGNIGSDTFAFTLQNAPTIVITSSGGLTNTLAVKLAGTVGLSDAGTTVHVLDGATEIGTALVQADGKWSAAVSLLNQQGSHQISASDTNAVGTGKSSSVSYTVDTVAPVVKLGLVQDTGASSTDKITTNSALTGTAEAGAKVTLSEGTTTLGSVTADSTGHWNFTPTGLKLGAHTILASQTDAAGNIGSDTFAFTLESSAPASTSVIHTVAQGYEVVTTEANRVVTDSFDFNWQRTGAEIVTKDAPGKTIDQHFNGSYKQTLAEITTISQVDGGTKTILQHFDGTWNQTAAEITEVTQEGNRVLKQFYDASWHLTHAEIDTLNISSQSFGSTHEIFDENWHETTWMAYAGKHLDGAVIG